MNTSRMQVASTIALSILVGFAAGLSTHDPVAAPNIVTCTSSREFVMAHRQECTKAFHIFRHMVQHAMLVDTD